MRETSLLLPVFAASLGALMTASWGCSTSARSYAATDAGATSTPDGATAGRDAAPSAVLSSSAAPKPPEAGTVPSGSALDAQVDTGAPPVKNPDAGPAPLDASSVEDAGSGSSTPDAASDASSPEPLPECAVARLTGAGSLSADTRAAADGSFTSGCAPVGLSDDVAFLWQAPHAGYYAFATTGSSFDTVLALREPTCDGVELACNDDLDGSLQSEVIRKFAQHEEVLVVIDGKVGGNGTAVLVVSEVECPNLDLTEQLLPATLSTLDGTDEHEGACGGASRREKAVRWVAPTTGLYRFSAYSNEFSPALYLERGARCGGELLQCNSGTASFASAWITEPISAGEAVTLIVDSNEGAGSFQLDAQLLDGAACPDRRFDPLSDDPVADALTYQDVSVLSGSCVPAEVVMPPNGNHQNPERSFLVSVPARATCSISVLADGPVALYTRESVDCRGPELSCSASEIVGGENELSISIGDLSKNQAEERIVVVEALGDLYSAPLNYTLYGLCALP